MEASGEDSEHSAIPVVRHVIGASAGRNEELRPCAQTEPTPRLSQQAHVEADARIGDGIGVLSDIHRRCGHLIRPGHPAASGIDLHIEVPAVPYQELRSKDDGVTSAEIRALIAQESG